MRVRTERIKQYLNSLQPRSTLLRSLSQTTEPINLLLAKIVDETTAQNPKGHAEGCEIR